MDNFAIEIHAANGREAVLQACRTIMAEGDSAYPRGKRTKELLFARLIIEDPTDIVADRIQRKGLLPAIGYGEGLQCIAGVSAPGLMADISSGFPKPSSRWATDVPTYAERLNEANQLDEAARTLFERDVWSRQCVALIWRPDDQVGGQAHNLCTIGLQFLLRDGRLHMGVHMRSNDAWHGLPYDLQQFSMIQQSMAVALECEVGQYVHSANSLHLYDRHWDSVDELLGPLDGPPKPRPGAVGRPLDDWPTIRERAAMLLKGETPVDPTLSELLYAEALWKYTHKEEAA